MHVIIHGKVKTKCKSLPNEFRNRHARYNDIVGFTGQALYHRIAAEILAEYYEDLRLEANFFPKNNTDITILSHNHVLLKLEVLNWWVNTYLTQERAFKIRDNLYHSPYSAVYYVTIKPQAFFKKNTQRHPCILQQLSTTTISILRVL